MIHWYDPNLGPRKPRVYREYRRYPERRGHTLTTRESGPRASDRSSTRSTPFPLVLFLRGGRRTNRGPMEAPDPVHPGLWVRREVDPREEPDSHPRFHGVQGVGHGGSPDRQTRRTVTRPGCIEWAPNREFSPVPCPSKCRGYFGRVRHVFVTNYKLLDFPEQGPFLPLPPSSPSL